jgi:hypothetical protein
LWPLITLSVSIAFGDVKSEPWTAEPKFRIEDKSYAETLIFVSGVAYALTASNSELAKASKEDFFCTKDSHIGSKLLIDILTDKHTGDITSEQAIETIVQGLKRRFPCN